MENPQLSMARQMFARMALKPGERVLDLSCGTGWATRMAAEAVAGGAGMAVGMDISEESIAQARAESREAENALFAVGAAEEIPWRDEYFDSVFSIESFSRYRDQEAVLRELRRVLVSGGRLCILIHGQEENPLSQDSAEESEEADLPPTLRSESAYEQMLRAGGFVDIASAQLNGLAETPGRHLGSPLSEAGEAAGGQSGALLWVARRA